MSIAELSPAGVSGRVQAPPSKSMAHRAILCACLSRGRGVIENIARSADMAATMAAMEALGARFSLQGTTLSVDATELFSVKRASIDCGESGSTLRFIIPVAAAAGVEADFFGHGRLPQRPLDDYLRLFDRAGMAYRYQKGGAPLLSVSSRLTAGEYTLSGDTSSQYLSGLLLALPLCGGESTVRLTSPLQSRPYVDMTLAVMRDFGVRAEETDGVFRVPGGQRYSFPGEYAVEGDWSQAAFFLVAGVLAAKPGQRVEVAGLRRDSLQGDRAVFDLLRRFGGEVEWENGAVVCRKSALSGISIDAAQIPDLVPALGAVAAFSKGETVIFNAQRLRVKESDRIRTVCDGIRALGGKAEETADGLVIRGQETLPGGNGDGANDHRIVMALSAAALACAGPSSVTWAQAVNKSYPDFFRDYKTIGGKAHVVGLE